jgi:hypothetical protein
MLQEGRWIEAFQMLADCLKSAEDEQNQTQVPFDRKRLKDEK